MSCRIGHYTPRPFRLTYYWRDPRQRHAWRVVRRQYASRPARDAAAAYVSTLMGVRDITPIDGLAHVR